MSNVQFSFTEAIKVVEISRKGKTLTAEGIVYQRDSDGQPIDQEGLPCHIRRLDGVTVDDGILMLEMSKAVQGTAHADSVRLTYDCSTQAADGGTGGMRRLG